MNALTHQFNLVGALVQCEPHLRDRLYLTLDDPETHERARLAPRELLRSAPLLTLDEVQREPSLLLAVKRAVDEDRPRRAGRFVLTGSTNLLLMQRVSETLAGRATYVTLWPLTRRERLGAGTAGIWSQLFATPSAEWPGVLDSEGGPGASWRELAAIHRRHWNSAMKTPARYGSTATCAPTSSGTCNPWPAWTTLWTSAASCELPAIASAAC